jgi:hypothetical protein
LKCNSLLKIKRLTNENKNENATPNNRSRYFTFFEKISAKIGIKINKGNESALTKNDSAASA